MMKSEICMGREDKLNMWYETICEGNKTLSIYAVAL